MNFRQQHSALNETTESTSTIADVSVRVQEKPKKRQSFVVPERTDGVQTAARLEYINRIKTLEKEKQDWIQLYESRKEELAKAKSTVNQQQDSSVLKHNDLEFVSDMPDYLQLQKEMHELVTRSALVLLHHKDIIEGSQKLVTAITRQQSVLKKSIISQVKHQ